MIMMVGLPAAGKTTWVNKHVEENREKRYNVIGTAALIEKMKVLDLVYRTRLLSQVDLFCAIQVNGEPRKQHYEGKWDALIQKCTRCLQDWLRLASQRRRNYIIDQVRLT